MAKEERGVGVDDVVDCGEANETLMFGTSRVWGFRGGDEDS